MKILFEEVDDSVKSNENALGAFAIKVPQYFLCLGLNNTNYARLLEVVRANDLGVGIILVAHQSIGSKGIFVCGTPEPSCCTI